MAKRLAFLLASAALSTGAATAASACSVVVPAGYVPTPSDLRIGAKQTVLNSTAIYDGIVVEAETNDRPARIRVTRVFKGPAVAFFYMAAADSCDYGIDGNEIGKRGRFVLQRGPDVYSTWVSPFTHDSYIDWALRSDRRKDWGRN